MKADHGIPLISDEAANYDAKHEKTITEISRRIEARRGLIGIEWVEDDEDDSNEEGRAVRVLDYACGTGSMSRVSPGHFLPCDCLNLEYTEDFSRGRSVSFLFVFLPILSTRKLTSIGMDRPLRRTLRNAWALTSPRRWWACTTRARVIRYAITTRPESPRPFHDFHVPVLSVD